MFSGVVTDCNQTPGVNASFFFANNTNSLTNDNNNLFERQEYEIISHQAFRTETNKINSVFHKLHSPVIRFSFRGNIGVDRFRFAPAFTAETLR
jgi:hypothetical protein